MPEFIHLHSHTQYSLLDGAASISSMYKKAVKDEMKALTITDHGNMFGVFDFVAEAGKHKLADGTQHLVGFVTGKEAEIVRSGKQAEIALFPDPWEDATELVSIPLTRAIPSKKGPSREGGNGLKLAIV